jgi:hypothetical protein
MSKSRAELAALGAARHWTVRPLSQELINHMLSDEYDWNCQFNLEAVEAALNPPPPPAPPSEAEVRSQKVAALSEEFIAWAKLQKRPPDALAFEDWTEERKDAAKIKEIEAEVQKFLDRHPEFVVSESNRKILLDHLDGVVSLENLERSFVAARSSLTIDESKAVDPDRPETRPGQWRNGIFTPFDTGGLGTVKQFPVGQRTPGASSEDVVIRKRPERMTAAEFAEACRTSKAFRAKFDNPVLL